ncbi:MAG TPA: hydantoinase/oxoprolinase family protein [Planosporangium sp.]|jgi:N-methylhydantoinase A|nr:hydantoinase/oxoprolinase family protein [Planosporangium sp.]
MSTVIGVDVGGTFTDLVLRDGATGQVIVAKEPTVPANPERGVLAAIDAAVSPSALRRCRYLMHGTTVGLNALLERRGATVGLLTTRGFRDVLEIRRGDRDDPYDLYWKPRPPLVPRRLRLEIDERIGADGAVVRGLDAAGVLSAVEVLRAADVDSIAVVLINAYANPAHELFVEGLLRAAGWDGDLSLSHRVSGEYREYERTSTTVVDAFVRRRMGPYLWRLRDELAARGFAGQLLVTRSGGGALTVPEVEQRPFETIMSGPVAGAAALARLATRLDIPVAIGADAGGTSFDTVVVEGGRMPLLFEGSVEGMPLQSPWVDVRSIGAGGGSVAQVDDGGLLRVGPRSAGADPGPACYQRGGIEPTVTDAAVLLGMFRPGALSGGVGLSVEFARRALERLAQPAGLPDAHAVADGVLRIAAAHMAQAIRGITIERGIDPRGAALVAFGGAGPLFGCLVADELDIDRIVVPPNAGNFSAVGLLCSDVTRAAGRTFVRRLDAEALTGVRAVADRLLVQLDPAGAAGVREVSLDLRYAGQEHVLTRVLSPEWGAEGVIGDFQDEYRRVFGHRLSGDVEVVTVRATAHTPLDLGDALVPAPPEPPAGAQQACVWSMRARGWMPAQILTRGDIAARGPLAGPLIVVEATATTYVDDGFTAEVDTEGCLIVARKEQP